MGLFSKIFGGGDSTSSTTTSTTTNNADRRFVVDAGSVGLSAEGSTVTVNSTDRGAVQSAFDMSVASSKTSAATMLGALGLVADSMQFQQSQVTRAAQEAVADDAPSIFDGIEPAHWALIGLAVFGVVWVMGRR